MGHKFAELAFTDSVKTLQEADGSRASYARMEGGEDYNDALSARESDFIAARDSFYMATVGETGWPYLQHRGGPAGFLKVIDERTLAFPDFSGNRQFVSAGNLLTENRASLFLMDYANRKRLKLLGRVQKTDDPDILRRVTLPDHDLPVERAFVIRLEAFDWNCPKYITPRFTETDVAMVVGPMQERIDQLEALLGATR